MFHIVLYKSQKKNNLINYLPLVSSINKIQNSII